MAVKKRIPRKKESLDKKYSKLKIINIVLLLLIVTLSVSFVSYIYFDKKTEPKQKTVNKIPSIKIETDKKFEEELAEYKKERIEKYNKESKKFEEYTEDLDKDYLAQDIKDAAKNEVKEEVVIQQEPKKEEVVVKQAPIIINDKPKLAIVIDDVTTTYQIKAIKNLGYTVNISIMPPTSNHQNSADIAKGLDFYMIHFPLQATNFKFEEENTLHVEDSYQKIEKRVAQIRAWYPDAKYTNNHTGSKFTSNKAAMDRLYQALIKYDFIFVDSRTTSKSAVKEVAKKYNMPYIARNIFLDNTQEFDYIQNQLKRAIEISKKHGYAIAIGHPHKITMKVLKESKDLLTGLDLVYIYKIPPEQ